MCGVEFCCVKNGSPFSKFCFCGIFQSHNMVAELIAKCFYDNDKLKLSAAEYQKLQEGVLFFFPLHWGNFLTFLVRNRLFAPGFFFKGELCPSLHCQNLPEFQLCLFLKYSPESEECLKELNTGKQTGEINCPQRKRKIQYYPPNSPFPIRFSSPSFFKLTKEQWWLYGQAGPWTHYEGEPPWPFFQPCVVVHASSVTSSALLSPGGAKVRSLPSRSGPCSPGGRGPVHECNFCGREESCVPCQTSSDHFTPEHHR